MNLPLDTYREIIGYHPYHFWQFENAQIPAVSNCNRLVYKYPYQDTSRTGRSDLERAIQDAQNLLFEYLNYRVGDWFVEKRVQYPTTKTDQWRITDPHGRFRSVNVEEGYIRCLGVKQFTAVELDVSVTYSDENGDGIIDTFTATATIPAELTYDSLAVYFSESDWLNSWSRDDAQIKPANVSVSGTTVTITGNSWLLAEPVRYEGFNKNGLDPDDTAVYVDTLDLYAISVQEQGTLVSNAPVILEYEYRSHNQYLSDYGTCADSIYWGNAEVIGTGLSRVYLVPSSGVVRDHRRGEIGIVAQPQPDRVAVRYRAGATFQEINNSVTSGGSWNRAIAALATAMAGKPICNCETANQLYDEWSLDRSLTAGRDGETYAISEEDLNNPFGTKRGEIYAYKQVKNLKFTRAFAL